MSNLLALDQASVTTGWSVWENDKLVKWGKFTIDDSDMGERLLKIRKRIDDLIETYKIDEVVFEDIQMQANRTNNVHTYKVLAEVIGVLEERLTELKIPYTMVPASVWKSTLGIKGAARAEQKKNAQLYVLNTYGIKATQDECDAICIGAHKQKKNNSAFDWN